MDNGPRRLVMRAEYGAESPLWDEDGAMAWLDSLPLPSELQEALAQWAAKGWEAEDEAVTAEGRRLYARVVGSLGGTEVVWGND